MADEAPPGDAAVWWPRVRNFLAGYNSGIFLVLAGHPFDTIKVRLQAEGTLSTRFQGPLHCVRETLAHEGVRGLYKGMAAYVRCIEMLRDPSQVKKDEKLRTGSGAAAEGSVLAVDGLTQKVGRIRTALALDVALALPEVLRQANVAMGTEQSGSLPEQTDRLVLALGLQ